MELGKAPRVEAPFGFNRLVFLATSNAGSSTNVFQVLKDDSTAGCSVLDNAFGEDVIVIFSLPKQLARKRFQVPFSRFGTLFLKFALQAENASFLFLPSLLAQELTGRGLEGLSFTHILESRLTRGLPKQRLYQSLQWQMSCQALS